MQTLQEEIKYLGIDQGILSNKEVKSLFQYLIDQGLYLRMGDRYKRNAQYLIMKGVCYPKADDL